MDTTPLPASGVGFVTNNRGPSGAAQFGQKSTIDACLAVGKEWSVSHPHPFSIGQISKKGGGGRCRPISLTGWASTLT